MMNRKRIKILLALFTLLLLGKFAYKYAPWRIEFLGFYEKVWAHRVDSIDKLESALSHFKGVEVDLVFQEASQTLDVGHPPVPSIGLTFENYLKAIPNGEEVFIWMDIKNLTVENAPAILKRISLLLEERNYPKSLLLIESQQPESLQIFSKDGFFVSYYLPYGLGEMDTFSLQKEVENIHTVLANNKSLGVSSSYLDYEVMSLHFPNTTKYLWKIDGVTPKNFFQTRKILKDSTVKVVLTHFRSLKGNR
ncbi:MAG: hypothetical protein R2793_03535 [Flavobacteriaceae bacterium]